MIDYKAIARVRREAENILVLVDELAERGIPKEVIVKIILNEHEKANRKDEYPSEDE